MDGDRERVRTARLLLRRPGGPDADFLLTLMSDPATTEHNPSERISTRDAAEALLRRWDAQWEAGLGYWIVQDEDGRAVGVCGVKAVALRGRPVWNLLYRFLPATWGRGFAREAAAAAVRIARTADPTRLVVARVRPANGASARVAAAVGLHHRRDLDLPGEDGFDEVWADGGAPTTDARTA